MALRRGRWQRRYGASSMAAETPQGIECMMNGIYMESHICQPVWIPSWRHSIFYELSLLARSGKSLFLSPFSLFFFAIAFNGMLPVIESRRQRRTMPDDSSSELLRRRKPANRKRMHLIASVLRLIAIAICYRGSPLRGCRAAVISFAGNHRIGPMLSSERKTRPGLEINAIRNRFATNDGP